MAITMMLCPHRNMFSERVEVTYLAELVAGVTCTLGPCICLRLHHPTTSFKEFQKIRRSTPVSPEFLKILKDFL